MYENFIAVLPSPLAGESRACMSVVLMKTVQLIPSMEVGGGRKPLGVMC